MSEFLGHFHPLVVHLPIGIVLIGLLLQFLARKEKYKLMQPAISITLLAGAVSAFISCISGYLLSISDDYDASLVSWHMWMGIGVALVALMLYAKEQNPQFAVPKTLLAIALLVLVTVTGHLGGSLTHGSDYLTKPLTALISGEVGESASAAIKPVANVQEAAVYSEVVKPILETKCYSCHGANKQKGGLRMDDSLRLMKGGEDGVIIEPGNAQSSEMIKRLLLPVDNDDHMPPREKSQLTEQQVAILHWWISNGAVFDKKVKELPQDDQIKPALLALQQPVASKSDISFIPAAPVSPADEKVLAQLKQKGIVVLPVAKNSNYLQASFVTDTIVDAADLQLLQQAGRQLVWLNLSGTTAGDDEMAAVAKLGNLTRLNLSGTAITDKAMQQLTGLKQLQYLNLVNTTISTAGLMQLKPLQQLQSLYIYKTNTPATAYAALKASLPKTTIDTGGYIVPMLATDTTEVKEKKAY